MLSEARKASGDLIYINNLRIEGEMFSRYERVLLQWPHIKLHAFVVFDPVAGFTNQVFELDGQLFHDAQFMLGKARRVQTGVEKQRELPYARHRILHTLLRPAVSVLFMFVEAYLNGIAFDAFQVHHDSLAVDDHDLLAEWNSDRKRTSFVAFEKKVFAYPLIAAKLAGREIDLSGLGRRTELRMVAKIFATQLHTLPPCSIQ